MNITQIIGKQIYSIFEGQNIGTISQVLLDKTNTKLKGIKFFDNEENEYFVCYKDIFAISDNVLIKNNSKCEEVLDSQYQNTTLFKNAISEKGENLGKIIDAEIDENGKISHFLTDTNNKLLPNKILLAGGFVLVCNSAGTKLCDFRPKKVKILGEAPKSNIKVKILQMEPRPQNLDTPKRVTFNPQSLIGKRAKSTLFGQNNEVIVKADQIITDKIIFDAKRHSRLNQLYFVAANWPV